MQLEDYFDFLAPDDIRIKGHRIGIDNVLDYYLNGCNATEIARHFPGLSMEKIYATLTYYHHNRRKMDAFLLKLKRSQEKKYQEWAANPSPLVKRLRKIKEQREKELLEE